MLPKAVIFDVDGVLFDTEVMIRRGWEEVSTRMGWPQVGESYMDYVGQSRRDIMARHRAVFGPGFDTEAFLIAVTDFCTAHWESEGLPLKPGLMDILDYLREKRIPLALATSTRSTRTARRMEVTGLGYYFDAIVCGDMVAHSKPDPDIYLMAAEKLGIDPKDCMAVEDSPNGIRSAHAAGMQVIMIPDLVPYTLELDRLLLTHLDSLTDLRNYLNTLE